MPPDIVNGTDTLALHVLCRFPLAYACLLPVEVPVFMHIDSSLSILSFSRQVKVA